MQFAKERGLEKSVDFFREKSFVNTPWMKRDDLSRIVLWLSSGDILITPKLSMLGGNIKDVMDLLEKVIEKKITLHVLEEKLTLLGSESLSMKFYDMLRMFDKLDWQIKKYRSLEAVHIAREKGSTLGRPVGTGKSKLDKHIDEIKELLKQGSKQNYIAKKFGVTPANVSHFLKKHGLDKIDPVY